MNYIQAALGLNQMKRLDNYVERRNKIAKVYDENLQNLLIVTPWHSPQVYSSYHLYPICIKETKTKKTQRKIFKELIDNQIGANLHYTPVHRHPYYEKLGFKKNDFPIAEKFHREVISIPIFASLKDKEQMHVIETLKKIVMT